jgi:hypothetical protein
MAFFTHLNELGLIEIKTIEETHYLHPDKINAIEKMIRLHHELDINPEGIDAIFHLLDKLEVLENELMALRNKLRRYDFESEEK